MPQPSVNATIILRNDLANNWTQKNPILAKGELGAENDTGLLKIGDGITHYNDLSYINNSAMNLTNYMQKISNATEGNLVALTVDGDLIDAGIPFSSITPYTLPIASSSVLGGVLSSNLTNYIQIDLDGHMEVNNITTDKLINGLNEFVLNGGHA